MSPIPHFISFIFAVATTISQTQRDVTVNCRTAPEFRRHVSTSTLAPPMDSTCIAINLTLNVENILADPSYIIPQENIEVVQTALQQTLKYYDISPTISSLPSTLPTSWTVNNECPSLVDNTANKYNFIPFNHDITVDASSMNINYGSNNQTVQIQWQFITPNTIVYDFNAQSLSSLIRINCMRYSMKAFIVDSEMLIVAESTIFSITNNMNQQVQQMSFVDVHSKLESNTVYSLYIRMFNMFQCINNQPEIYWTSMPTSASPVISILAEPSSCRLAKTLTNAPMSPTSGFAFAVNALCQEALSTASRKLFEEALHQQHSSKKESAVPELPVSGVRKSRILDQFVGQNEGKGSRRRLADRNSYPDKNWWQKMADDLEKIGWTGEIHIWKLEELCAQHATLTDSEFDTLELLITNIVEEGYTNITIIKCPNGWSIYDQGIHTDVNSQDVPEDKKSRLRITEQGGSYVSTWTRRRLIKHDRDGNWKKLEEEINKLEDANLPSGSIANQCAHGMCQYYKNVFNGNREYIMIINGVKDINRLIDIDLWYNDIMFIPLDYNERLLNNLPKIKLKHAVIDPTLYVTESNELYIFGGRDGLNAKNYIQYIDLNVVFSSSSADILTTMDRFEPMRLNRVSPLIAMTTLKAGDIYDECMLVFGGQDFVNDEFIDTEIPPNGLQMYCNQLNPDPMKAAAITADAEFTSFDINNLQKVDNFVPSPSNVRTISINKYNFVNDNILYQFTTSSKACFESETLIKSAETLFKDTLFQDTLWNNIILQSQDRFKGWNNGFGAIYGVDTVLAKPFEIILDTANVNTLCSGLSEVSCISKVDLLGIELCKYNVNDNLCFGR